MSSHWKVKMGQPVRAANGDDLRLADPAFGIDPRTVAIIVQEVINKAGLTSDLAAKLTDRLNEVCGKPLILAEVVGDALLSFHKDETLSGAERSNRNQMWQRIYRTGMVKLSEGDVKFIMPIVERHYGGSLISPQVEALLNGKAFTVGLAEGDEEDEQATTGQPAVAP